MILHLPTWPSLRDLPPPSLRAPSKTSAPSSEPQPISTPGPFAAKPSTKSSTRESLVVRSFTAKDAPEVALLWQKCFRGITTPPSRSVEQYFTDVFLNHPWFDAELAPLVLDRQGEVVGFIGRMARPMLYRGQRIRCAVATQLMVDPDRRLPFAAMQLLRAVHSGPHDLCYSDGANDQSVAIWQRCGGQASRLLSFEWMRALRPMQSLCYHLRKHDRLRALAWAAHPVSGLFDVTGATLLPRLYHKPVGRLARRIATAEEILPLLLSVSATAGLHPEYSAESFSWLLAKVGESRSLGELRSVIVLGEEGEAVGWFIYFANKGGTAQVLQSGARHGHGLAVLGELFRDAWEGGAAAVSGGFDPMLVTELSNSHCQFHCPGFGVLVQSRNADLLHAVQQGEGFISRLEGEWWLRLGVDRHYQW